MKKLEKDLYIKHAKRLQAILDEQSSFVRFLTRKDFNQVIQNELNVLAACEQLFPKVDLDAKYNSKALTKQFNKLTKGSFKLNEKFKYEDQTDLIDAINYLTTFCNNMFRVNLDDVVSGKKVTATDPHIDLKAKPEFDDETVARNANFAFAGAGMPFTATPYENPYIIGKAQAKVADDLRTGKFYAFKTKPRIIPIVKWIACVLTMLLILGLLASGILFYIIGNPLDGTFYLLATAFGIYPLVMTMGSLVGKKGRNPNLRYHFNWTFILMFLILAVLFASLNTASVWLIDLNNPEVTYTKTEIIGVEGLRISLIICLVLTLLCAVPMIIGAVKNPKQDDQAIDRKIKEYIDLFTAESGQMPVPPKADVQKPQDVKPSKKDGKSKKDEQKK